VGVRRGGGLQAQQQGPPEEARLRVQRVEHPGPRGVAVCRLPRLQGVLPRLGPAVYLIARGSKMAQHVQQAAVVVRAGARSYIQSAAGTVGSAASEIQRLHDLKTQGVISDEEFEAGKAKALAR